MTATAVMTSYGAMNVAFTQHFECAFFTITGLVTASALRQLVNEIPRQSSPPPVIKVCVASYERALVMVSADSLNSLFDTLPADSMLRIPAALIVPPSVEQVFNQHAWDVAQKGVMRAIFTEAAPAREWAAHWAGL